MADTILNGKRLYEATAQHPRAGFPSRVFILAESIFTALEHSKKIVNGEIAQIQIISNVVYEVP